MEFSRHIQIVLLIFSAIAILIWFQRLDVVAKKREIRQMAKNHATIERSATVFSPMTRIASDDLINYSHCPPLEPLRIYVHDHHHPLARALATHASATTDPQLACMFIAFIDTEDGEINNPLLHHPSTWNATGVPGSNHVLVNLNDHVSIAPEGREMIVQAQFNDGYFRPLLDVALLPNVDNLDIYARLHRPSATRREVDFAIVVDGFRTEYSSRYPEVGCSEDCALNLLTTTFCLLPPSPSFQTRLLSSLRAGCIPVVLSSGLPLPFQDQFHWQHASFRFPLSFVDYVPEKLRDVTKDDVVHMRMRGRKILAQIDDTEALSDSLIKALAERIQIDLI